MQLKAIVNYKTYRELSGKKGLELAKIIEKYADRHIGVAPQMVDISLISMNTNIAVFSQHVDPIEPGRHTGFVSPYSIKQASCKGTLLNHSEHRLDKASLKQLIAMCKKNRLMTVCCANNMADLKQISALRPNVLVYEPPELIATGISVSRAKVSVLEEAATLGRRKRIPLWCGAGISSLKDVEMAFQIGAKGILVASWIAKSKNKKQLIKDLAELFESL
ncbi:triose-phosphate isomerase [Candidatus Micrarchaeota archaeon]|nr:MAG: triose-phosphate isomerase [Candidatus Micrarchaeota archaeon]